MGIPYLRHLHTKLKVKPQEFNLIGTFFTPKNTYVTIARQCLGDKRLNLEIFKCKMSFVQGLDQVLIYIPSMTFNWITIF